MVMVGELSAQRFLNLQPLSTRRLFPGPWAVTDESMRLATASTKGWTLEDILARSANFYAVPSKNVEHLAADEIECVVRDFEESGIPLLMKVRTGIFLDRNPIIRLI